MKSRSGGTGWFETVGKAGAALILAAAASLAQSYPGQLDNTFGCTTPGSCMGTAMTGVPAPSGQASAFGLALQSDGKVVLAGAKGLSSTADFGLARFNSNGTLDTTFGSGGTVSTAIQNNDDHANAVAIQADGKIVAAGSSLNGTTFAWSMALARYNANGTPDTGFGTKLVALGTVYNDAFAVAIDAAGNILMAGRAGDSPNTDFAVVRYTAGGMLDPNFAGSGKVRTVIPISCSGGCVGQAQAIAIQPDGKIVVAGWSGTLGNAEFVIVRYNSNGMLDTGFGTNGIKVHGISTGNDTALAAKVITLADSTQRILVVGTTNPTGSKANYAIARYLMNGAVDTGFGTNGVVTTTLSGGNDIATSVAVDGAGMIVVGGDKNDVSGDFVVARYTQNGALDNTFGCATPGTCSGIAATNLSGSDQGKSVAIQPDGNIVLGGTAAAGTSSAKFGVARFLGGGVGATQLAVTSVNGANPVSAGAGFAVVVESRNATGAPTNVGAPTQVSLALTTGTGPLGGTASCTIAAGANTCTASGLTLTTAQGGAIITASRVSGDPLANGSSAPFSVVAGPGASLSIVSGSGQSTTVNTNFGLPLVAALSDAYGNPVTNQAITFTAPVGNQGATFAGGASTINAITDSSGSASSGTVKANLVSGAYTVSATYAAVPAATFSLTNNKAASSTSIGLSGGVNPSPINSTLTYTATVSGAAGTPTGNVTFTADGSTVLCSGVPLNASAQASCSTQLLAVGAHTVSAQYGGNATYIGSTSGNVAQSISKTTPTLTITSTSPNPSAVNAPAVVNYSLTPAPSGPFGPTGTVTVSDGTVSCSASTAAGQCSVTFTSAGPKTLTASYSGDGNFNGATSAGYSHTVSASAATVTLSANPQSIPYGSASTISATVSGTQGTPTGTVAVSGAGGSCTITLSSGSGSCNLTGTTIGAGQTITGNYSGNATYSASTATTQLTVTKITPSVSVSVNPSTINAGSTTTVTATVSGSAGTPTGTVGISGAGGTCTVTLNGGTGTCSLVGSTPGANQTVTGSYSGDSRYSTETATTTLSVNPGSVTVTLSANPGTITFGASSTITATVSGSLGTPTGSVSVSGAGANCTITLSGGTGNCVLTPTAAGASQTVSGNYSGNGTYGPGIGTTTLNVNKATPTVTLSVNPTTIGAGGTTTASATVASPAGTPTGSVSVSGAGGSCTITLSGGSGSCTLTGSTLGQNQTVTGNYSGNANFNPASGTTTLSVSSSTASVVLSANPPTISLGGTSTMTATVSGSSGTPTGSVLVSGAGGGCTITLSGGTGNCTLTGNTVGNNQTITGSYSGNATYGASSGSTTLTVQKLVPIVTINVTPNSTDVGSPVTANVFVNASGPTPTGTVSVSGAGGTCNATLSGGSGTCQLTPTISGNGQTVVANYSGNANYTAGSGSTNLNVHGTLNAPILDVDLNGNVDALTDGLMVVRYLIGFSGPALTNAAIGPNAQRTDPAQIDAYLDSVLPDLDVDGNGSPDALTDGIMIVRYLFGIRGAALINGAVGPNATRNTAAQIEAYIATLVQ